MKYATQNEKILHKELQMLQKTVYGKTYEEMNAREQAEANTQKLENGGESRHMGKHTDETITQEIFSLCNVDKAFFNDKNTKRLNDLIRKIERRTDIPADKRSHFIAILKDKLEQVAK